MSTRHILLFGFMLALVVSGCRRDPSLQRHVDIDFDIERDSTRANVFWITNLEYSKIPESDYVTHSLRLVTSHDTVSLSAYSLMFVWPVEEEVLIEYKIEGTYWYGKKTKSKVIDQLEECVYDRGAYGCNGVATLNSSQDTLYVDYPQVVGWNNSPNPIAYRLLVPSHLSPGTYDYWWQGPKSILDRPPSNTQTSTVYAKIFENSDSLITGRTYYSIGTDWGTIGGESYFRAVK